MADDRPTSIGPEKLNRVLDLKTEFVTTYDYVLVPIAVFYNKPVAESCDLSMRVVLLLLDLQTADIFRTIFFIIQLIAVTQILFYVT